MALFLLVLAGCTGSAVYQAYPGPERLDAEVAVISGQQYLRRDWLNRYVDAVRISSIDDLVIEGSNDYSRVEVTPGTHEFRVYFFWDLGSRRGLAQALVQYASSRQTLSRTLRFDAEAGKHYIVMAEPEFAEEGDRDITNMAYVDFWVEDEAGNIVVSREQGRYISTPP